MSLRSLFRTHRLTMPFLCFVPGEPDYERTRQAILKAAGDPRHYRWLSHESKLVTLTLHTTLGPVEDLPSMFGPVREALTDMNLIHWDAPEGGHKFIYLWTGATGAKSEGVTIHVNLLPPSHSQAEVSAQPK